MAKIKFEVLGESFIVDGGSELSDGTTINTTRDIAIVFNTGGHVVTIPTNRGDVTFSIPDGGLAIWAKDLQSPKQPRQIW
ncbi:MAG: hypothetical protein E7A72_08270 [Actinomyces urogenitalis]|uniref:hypothetical protein n=1 Tax=Actinomyces urogenitalis TaxID=103621 RepID=UPI00242F9FC2|nr:hypothetical protein [Actinomyces urogenitalis]MBS5977741.1 hypothetical protein [Actinomyces urogenitalis]MDU0972873.1 hypothetical protein [Actinomyces urogenitalis]